MPHDSKYIQFPISVLQAEWRTSAELCSDAIDLAVHHLASQPIDDDSIAWIAERYSERTDCDFEFDSDEERYLAACEYLEVSFSDGSAA